MQLEGRPWPGQPNGEQSLRPGQERAGRNRVDRPAAGNELAVPTSRQRLLGYAQQNPKSTHAEAVNWLVAECKIGRARANTLVNEVLGVSP